MVSNPNSNAYVNGQEVTLTATPGTGLQLRRLDRRHRIDTANPLVTLADANKTVTAQFSRNIIAPVTLTINAESGTVTRTPADELYEKGTSVELLAQANAGLHVHRLGGCPWGHRQPCNTVLGWGQGSYGQLQGQLPTGN